MPRKEATTGTPRRRLGRGLGSLISTAVEVKPPETQDPMDEPTTETGDRLLRLPVGDLRPNPRQPRQHFDEGSLDTLADSIRRAGVMQPIIVRPDPSGGYQIVAGERRWRAAQLIGLATIPAVLREVDDATAAEWALIENLHREDLNAIERGEAFRALERDFGLSHQQIAERVGIDRSNVSNHLRLLELDSFTQDAVRRGSLGMGHARALLAITNLKRRRELAERAIDEGWSVRALEACGRQEGRPAEPSSAPAGSRGPRELTPAMANIKALERQIGEQLGTKVEVQAGRRKGAGRLVLEYYDLDHFEGLLERLGVKVSL